MKKKKEVEQRLHSQHGHLVEKKKRGQMPDERMRKLSCCRLAIQASRGALSSCNGMALTRMFKLSQRFICFWLSCVDPSENLSVLELQKERGNRSFRYAGLERMCWHLQNHAQMHTHTVLFYCFSVLYYFGNSVIDKNVSNYNNDLGQQIKNLYLLTDEW